MCFTRADFFFSSSFVSLAIISGFRKEHQRDVKLDIIAKLTNEELKKKSALVKHVCLNGHRIDWESSEILATESDYKKRRF